MNCKLVGNFIQHIEVELMPGEDFYAEKGALIYLESGIEKEMAMSGGGGLRNLLGAKLSGESLLITRFYNRSNAPRRVVIGSHFGLLPVKIEDETLLCHRGVYVASSESVKVTTKISISGIMGGMGVFLQKISGRATVFLDCKGQPIVKDLSYGETIEVDEDHIIALHSISESQVSSAWSLKNVLGGEGLSMLRITGPGKVYLSPGTLVSQMAE